MLPRTKSPESPGSTSKGGGLSEPPGWVGEETWRSQHCIPAPINRSQLCSEEQRHDVGLWSAVSTSPWRTVLPWGHSRKLPWVSPL